MAAHQGYALCIGINSVNPKHYNGWDGALNACENDARDMINIAKIKGFENRKILSSSEATKEKVLSSLREISSKAQKGDLVLLTYSGDEEDGYDETWVLYDFQLVDDELYAELANFKEGVRIFVLSDSCHSGTVVRLLQGNTRGQVPVTEPTTSNRDLVVPGKVKAMPSSVSHSNYLEHHDYYEPILANKKLAKAKTAVKASVVLISGCQDNQTSLDGDQNGLFTETLKFVWNGGNYKGSISTFHKKILSYMPPTQSPNLDTIGNVEEFLAQKPFTI